MAVREKVFDNQIHRLFGLKGSLADLFLRVFSGMPWLLAYSSYRANCSSLNLQYKYAFLLASLVINCSSPLNVICLW